MPVPRIVVINPSADAAVTARLDRAVAPLRFAGGPEIRCETLVDGPLLIESQSDIEAVTEPLTRRVAAGDAAAWVIACYSDPGVAVCREVAAAPVFGIAESGLLAALQRGDHVGVIALTRRVISRYRRQERMLGIERRVAGARALELTPTERGDETATRRRLVEVGRQLKEEDGADVVVFGAADLAHHRRALEAQLALPVVDPTQAAVTSALGAVAFAAAEA